MNIKQFLKWGLVLMAFLAYKEFSDDYPSREHEITYSSVQADQ
jgi:hypothetical protein